MTNVPSKFLRSFNKNTVAPNLVQSAPLVVSLWFGLEHHCRYGASFQGKTVLLPVGTTFEGALIQT